MPHVDADFRHFPLQWDLSMTFRGVRRAVRIITDQEVMKLRDCKDGTSEQSYLVMVDILAAMTGIDRDAVLAEIDYECIDAFFQAVVRAFEEQATQQRMARQEQQPVAHLVLPGKWLARGCA